MFAANTPRRLRNGAAARNELRRNIRGIIKLTDVRIPLRDGSYVCADVFLPADDGQHPVIMNQGFYGKSFDHGVIGSEEDAQQKEELEDRYFTGNPDGLQYENHESVDSSVWVPKGYVCIRVDARGVGNSPGLQAPFSVQQAEDYYDAIEWAGIQPWSNGNVGLWGMSYLAITQHTVASLQPPHLKAMIALGTDADLYNEAFYGGGLYGEGFWTWWRMAMAGHNYNGERQETDWLSRMLATPFNDPDAYGGQVRSSCVPRSKRRQRRSGSSARRPGSSSTNSAAARRLSDSTGVQSKKFDFVDAWFPHSYKNSTIAEHHGVLRPLAEGRGQRRDGWRAGAGAGPHRERWPLHSRRDGMAASPGRPIRAGISTRRRRSGQATDYAPTSFASARGIPTVEASASYDAHSTGASHPGADRLRRRYSALVYRRLVHQRADDEDMVLVGYMKVGLWVASTSSDMDVYVSVRVLDEHDREIRYESLVPPIDPANIHPVGHGLLKVSHRKLDVSDRRSTGRCRPTSRRTIGRWRRRSRARRGRPPSE